MMDDKLQEMYLNNILLVSELEPPLSDFGTARLFNTDLSNCANVAGSYGYMAPGTSFHFIAMRE